MEKANNSRLTQLCRFKKCFETKWIRLLVVCSVILSSVNAQQEFNNWCFGNYSGLTFSTNPPSAFTSSITTPEGCATISDNAGNLLFYTNGAYVWDKTHSIMANGAGLLGNGSMAQVANIIKKPGSTHLYYIFTIGNGGQTTTLRYSMVDMALAAGLGSVTVKNYSLYVPTTEMQTIVRHCNGKDVWIVSHNLSSRDFVAFLLSSAGVSSTPVISSIGDPFTDPGSAAGYLKVSPDGRRLAMATMTNCVPGNTMTGGFQLFDFDPSTGIVSNSLALAYIPYAYGVEFSSDGSKLYGSTWITNPGTLFQWNLCAGSNSAIIASQYSVQPLNSPFGGLQRGIDSKIYLATPGFDVAVINNPNSIGTTMNLSLNAVSLAPNYYQYGFPNYINSYSKQSVAAFSSTVFCNNISFNAPSAPTSSTGCSVVSYPYSGYLWDFGEPSSGASNSSTLQSPSHQYSALGTYTVKLILYSQCSNDTLSQTVNITTPGPSITVTGPVTICKGEKRTYTAAGGTTYQWSNNTSGTTAALSPTQNTVYTVTGTAAGCSNSKSFTVTVDECLGIINEGLNSNILTIYPQPFSDRLSVETDRAGKLRMFDLYGRIVLESDLAEGPNELSTAEIAPGVYTVHTRTGEHAYIRSVIKVE
jgi:hypothetical protein